MNRSNRIAAGILAALCFGTTAIAVTPPPLDRPTPPACCADGYCYPKPGTWGVYEQSWRRWPTASLEPTPAPVSPPERLRPDIGPFDLPPKEEEDRRAPPKTKPPEPAQTEEGPIAPPAAAPRATPLIPPQDGSAAPRTRLPFEDDLPGTETPTPLPFSDPDTSPAMPTNPLPFGEPPTDRPAEVPFGQPTGDLDPPPVPPFGAPVSESNAVAARPQFRAADRPSPPAARPSAAPKRRGPSHDPPPSLPLSLAQAGF